MSLIISNIKTGGEFIDEIIKITSKVSGVSISELLAKTRKREIVQERQKAMKLAITFTNESSTMIGRKIGNKDHATVLHACKVVDNLCDTDRTFRGEYFILYERVEKVLKTIQQKERNDILVCEKCGSVDIYMTAKIPINNNMHIKDIIDPENEMINWCGDCKKNVKFISRLEYNKKEEKTAKKTELI